MEASGINESDLPFYKVQVLDGDKEWVDFSLTPIKTVGEAEARVEEIVANHCVSHERVRVVEYGVHDWRHDLIEEVMRDRDAVYRGLSVLRSGTLLDLLRE